jgi:hypothetical protein
MDKLKKLVAETRWTLRMGESRKMVWDINAGIEGGVCGTIYASQILTKNGTSR